MQLCRLPGPDGRPEYAFYKDGNVCPLRVLFSDAPREEELFDGSIDRLLEGHDSAKWSDAPSTLLPPVPLPEKVFCIGLNYRDHAIETGSPIPTEPDRFQQVQHRIDWPR